MKASALIAVLEELKELYGDLEVHMEDVNDGKYHPVGVVDKDDGIFVLIDE